MIIKTCKNCGKEYDTSGKLYCSHKCFFEDRGRSGENNPNYGNRKGIGNKIFHKHNGYILVRVIGGKGGKYYPEHRLVMERKLGRKLEKFEIVHHRNGVRTDNRIDNLEIVTSRSHRGVISCPYCQKTFNIK